MVQMNLFAEQGQTEMQRKDLWAQREAGGRGWDELRVAVEYTHDHV